MFNVFHYNSPCNISDFDSTHLYVPVQGIGYESIYPLPMNIADSFYGVMPKEVLQERVDLIAKDVYAKVGLVGFGVGRLLRKCVLPVWKAAEGCVTISQKSCSAVASLLKRNFMRAANFCKTSLLSIPSGGWMKCTASVNNPSQLAATLTAIAKNITALMTANDVRPTWARDRLIDSLLKGSAMAKGQNEDEDEIAIVRPHDPDYHNEL